MESICGARLIWLCTLLVEHNSLLLHLLELRKTVVHLTLISAIMSVAPPMGKELASTGELFETSNLVLT